MLYQKACKFFLPYFFGCVFIIIYFHYYVYEWKYVGSVLFNELRLIDITTYTTIWPCTVVSIAVLCHDHTISWYMLRFILCKCFSFSSTLISFPFSLFFSFSFVSSHFLEPPSMHRPASIMVSVLFLTHSKFLYFLLTLYFCWRSAT